MDKPFRVLLIDDDPQWRNTVISSHASKQFDFLSAENDDVLERIDLRSIDIIIATCQTPAIQGAVLLEKVKRDSPSIQVIIITLEENLKVAVALMRRGAIDCLTRNSAAYDLKQPLTRASRQISQQRQFLHEQEARKRAQAVISDKNLRLQAALASSVDPLLIVNSHGIVLVASDSVEDVFGWKPKELVARNIKVLIPEPHHSQHDDYLDNYQKTGKTTLLGSPREYKAVRKDGTLFPCEITVNLVNVPGQSQPLLIGILRDITQRKQDEQTLQQARDTAESANRAKTDFLANISHEIRTPMTAILGYAENLQESDLSKTERAEIFQTITRNSHHLLNLIDDILDMSKVEAGRLTVENIQCSPAQIVQNVADLLRIRTRKKQLSLDVQFQGPIPKFIQTDPTRLHQILVNLVGNAVKFTESGSVKVVVSLTDSSPQGAPLLRIDVIDTGTGIDNTQLEQIFTPFRQADSSTTRRFGGTGLGLAISKNLAHLLGGDLRVTSTPGTGSTFTLTIETGSLNNVTMLTDFSESLKTSLPEPSPAATLTDLSEKQILVVEDGEDNQKLISHFLEKSGAKVTLAENGQFAIDLIEQKDPDLFDVILMDIQMPILDGIEATRYLRAQGVETPIIALTAHAMPEDRQKCLQAGCDAFLTKPITKSKLLETVHQHANARPSTSPKSK